MAGSPSRHAPRRRMLGGMAGVTRILSAIEAGDPRAAEPLLPLVYEELRRLAAQKLVLEKPGQPLQATALVHQAHLATKTTALPGVSDRSMRFSQSPVTKLARATMRSI